MGCRAMVLLGSEGDMAIEPAPQTLYMPRYYVPKGPLAEALRGGEPVRGTIHCDGAWRRVTARNIYALVRPATVDPALPPIAVAAAYDSMSVIMGLAPGADRALDAAFALNTLREFAADVPKRPVLFCFLDADGINQLGVRQMLTMLNVTPEDPLRQRYADVDAALLELYTTLHEDAARLGRDAKAVENLRDKSRYGELRGYFKNVVGPTILKLKDECGDLRLAIDDATEAGDEARADELRGELEEKDLRQRLMTRTMTQVFTDTPISEDLMPGAIDIWHRALDRIDAQLADQKRRLTFFDSHDRIRSEILAAMGLEGERERPVSFVFGVDLSDAGATLGALVQCGYLQMDLTEQARPFVRWLLA